MDEIPRSNAFQFLHVQCLSVGWNVYPCLYFDASLADYSYYIEFQRDFSWESLQITYVGSRVEHDFLLYSTLILMGHLFKVPKARGVNDVNILFILLILQRLHNIISVSFMIN